MPKRSVAGNRQLEAGRAQVVEQHVEVVGVDQAVLGRAVEEVVRVRGQELVDGRGRADQGRQARPGPASGTTHLLPGGCDGARVADADGRVQAADVDAKLERVGCDHAAHAAVAQSCLDLMPLVGQIAAPVAADGVRVAGWRSERLAQVAGEDLDRGPRLRANAMVCTPPPMSRSAEPLAGEQRGAADAELLVGDRRVDDQHVPTAAMGRRCRRSDRRAPRAPAPASSRGLAMVALAQMKIGSAP